MFGSIGIPELIVLGLLIAAVVGILRSVTQKERPVMEPLIYTQGMTDNQKLLFMSEFNARRKNPTTGVLLALFLGGLGAHRFYMGQIGLGIVYLVFCLFLVPAIIAFFEAFLMSGRVARFNDALAQEIALKLKVMAGSGV